MISLKGENNSLRKKVQSLQIDFEKLNRRNSSLFSQEDNNFCEENTTGAATDKQ